MAAADTPHLILNAPLVATRLGYPDLSGLDLLELFAFIHPARFCVPTPKGLAHALGLDEPAGDDGVPALLQMAAAQLIETCDKRRLGRSAKARGARCNRSRGCAGPGRRCSRPYIRQPERAERWLFSRLPEWEEAPETAAAGASVAPSRRSVRRGWRN